MDAKICVLGNFITVAKNNIPGLETFMLGLL